MRHSLRYVSALIIVILFALPTSVFAHYAGYSFEQKVGNYKVDIGYDTKPIEANAPVTFDFNIKDIKTDEYLDFGDAWVRFENENTTYFATGVFRQPLGATTLVYTFPKAGKYSMYVRFENQDKQLVEATIPVTVTPNSEEGSTNSFLQMNTVIGIVIGVAAALILGGIVLFFGKKARKKPQQKKDE